MYFIHSSVHIVIDGGSIQMVDDHYDLFVKSPDIVFGQTLLDYKSTYSSFARIIKIILKWNRVYYKK